MNRGWYKFPFYLALEPKSKQVYRVPSWITINEWLEIPSTNIKFYTDEGDILQQYVTSPYYQKFRGSLRIKPR